jgi:hypothetical protein
LHLSGPCAGITSSRGTFLPSGSIGAPLLTPARICSVLLLVYRRGLRKVLIFVTVYSTCLRFRAWHPCLSAGGGIWGPLGESLWFHGKSSQKELNSGPCPIIYPTMRQVGWSSISLAEPQSGLAARMGVGGNWLCGPV